LYRAVNASRVVKVIYRLINDVEFEQDIRPLGLVAKAGVWYLVWEANGKVRHYRVAGLLEVEVLEERFTYPADFDLQAYWEKTCAESEAGYPSFKVVIWASAQAMPALARQAGEGSILKAGRPDNHGRQRLELAFESLEAARQRLLGLGRAVEVLEPESLRLSLADFARQIVQVYDEHE
jgi:predicted DNA-binding transcriptional regulator YafY